MKKSCIMRLTCGEGSPPGGDRRLASALSFSVLCQSYRTSRASSIPFTVYSFSTLKSTTEFISKSGGEGHAYVGICMHVHVCTYMYSWVLGDLNNSHPDLTWARLCDECSQAFSKFVAVHICKRAVAQRVSVCVYVCEWHVFICFSVSMCVPHRTCGGYEATGVGSHFPPCSR